MERELQYVCYDCGKLRTVLVSERWADRQAHLPEGWSRETERGPIPRTLCPEHSK